jgi:hypothetical protein
MKNECECYNEARKEYYADKIQKTEVNALFRLKQGNEQRTKRYPSVLLGCK